MKTNAQNLVNNKSTRTTWVILFWCTTLEVWVLRTQLKIYDGTFLSVQWKKAKIFHWVLNTPLNFWTYLTLITWLWFGWVTWGYSISFMSTFIQTFQTFILKKNSNNMTRKTNMAYSRNLGQYFTLAREGTFLRKRSK